MPVRTPKAGSEMLLLNTVERIYCESLVNVSIFPIKVYLMLQGLHKSSILVQCMSGTGGFVEKT